MSKITTLTFIAIVTILYELILYQRQKKNKRIIKLQDNIIKIHEEAIRSKDKRIEDLNKALIYHIQQRVG